MINILGKLFNTLGYIIALAFFFTKFKSAKHIFENGKIKKRDIVILSMFFSGLAMIGTYVGAEYKGAIVNTRNIGVIAGGILAGPQVAIIAGFVAGVHRLMVDVGKLTTIPCSIATILGGFLAAYYHRKTNNKNKYLLGFLLGMTIEGISMVLIYFLTPDKNTAIDIIQSIFIPMTLINGSGVAIVILITEEILETKEKEAGTQAKLALEIANKTLPLLRNSNSLDEVCEVVRESLGAQLVAITDRSKVIAKGSISKNIYLKNKDIQTEATKQVIETGEVLVFNKKMEGMDFKHLDESLKSCIIAPLYEDEKVSGTLKIYFDSNRNITARKQYLAIGISQLISTQLELRKIEELKAMARDAELRALQNQINPHFLFNALNTIAAFVRWEPGKAREMIIDLSVYLRYNLENIEKVVPFSKELEQVKAYVNIEKARFGDKFDIVYDLEEGENIFVPSLIIQPLVENSIKHGILAQREFGIVKIIGKIKQDKYIISIEDNGVGIKEEVINDIDTEIEKNIGLKNVHNRLKIMYGKGLKIEKLGKGTKIQFEIKMEDKCISA